METEQEITIEEQTDAPSGRRDTACRVLDEKTASESPADLMTELTVREAEVATLSQALVEKEDIIMRLNASLNAAVIAYRGSVVALHRELPEELIEGDSVNAVDESLKRAMLLVARLKSTMSAAAPPLVSAGRSRSSESLSTVDKIRVGLTH